MNFKTYQSKVLKGQTIPKDLEILLKIQSDRDETDDDDVSDPIAEMGVYFLQVGEDAIPDDSNVSKKEKNNPFYKANYPAVMSVMSLITFVGQILYEDADEDLLGYWHGPEKTPIEKAPIVKWSSDGFSILPGKNLIEAIVSTQDFSDKEFLKMRNRLSEYGFRLDAKKHSDLKVPKIFTHPNDLHGKLFADNFILPFQKEVLKGQAVPDDLRKLFRMQVLWPDEDNSMVYDPLGGMNCRILMQGEKVGVLDKSYLTAKDKKNPDTMANVKAIDSVCEYITFAAYTDDSELVGYWHGPEKTPIEKAPLVSLDTEGQFNQLSGKKLAEALLGLSHFDTKEFQKYTKWFKDFEIDIKAKSEKDLALWSKSSSSPIKLHKEMFEKFRKKS